MMIFDWDKAAKLIRERKPQRASAGLRGDWEYTGGIIFEDGKPVMDYYTYLASTWATPELIMDGDIVECYRMNHEVPGWNHATKWPKSALDILNADGPLTPPNEPLTIEQLREMNGEILWGKSLVTGKPGEWFIVHIIDMGRGKDWFISYSFASQEFGDRDTYGRTWLAYRRPPEGGEDA